MVYFHELTFLSFVVNFLRALAEICLQNSTSLMIFLFECCNYFAVQRKYHLPDLMVFNSYCVLSILFNVEILFANWRKNISTTIFSTFSHNIKASQQMFTCSNSITKALEKAVKYVQSQQ